MFDEHLAGRRRADVEVKFIGAAKNGWIGRSVIIALRKDIQSACARATDKRGGEAQRIAREDAVSLSDERDIDLLALDEAMKQLAEFDAAQSKIVELRFFGGLTIEETAHVFSISPATVKREWTMAKAWLFRRMKDEG